MSSPAKTMQAVVFDGPGKVSLQNRPVPARQFPRGRGSLFLSLALCGIVAPY